MKRGKVESSNNCLSWTYIGALLSTLCTYTCFIYNTHTSIYINKILNLRLFLILLLLNGTID